MVHVYTVGIGLVYECECVCVGVWVCEPLYYYLLSIIVVNSN